MNKFSRNIITFILLCGSGIAVQAWFNESVQPIPYNHKLHIDEAGLDCDECHLNVRTHARATIPNIQLCGDCHDDTEAENESVRIVANHVESGTQIEWNQVHLVPDHAYFSHRRHVAIAQIDCAECHGNVEQMEHPFEEPFVLMDMDWCMDCHNQRAVPKDCYACHR